MKKTLIIFYPSFEKGGVTKILINLMKSKFAMNYDLHLISSRNVFKDKFNKNKNFKFHKVNGYKNLRFIPQRFKTAFSAMKILNHLLVNKHKKIVVHSMQSNIAAILVCIIKKKKIIIRNSENPIYSTIFSENKFSAIITFFMKLFFYNFSDGIVTNSKGSAKSLGYFVFNNRKIKTIYNPYLKNIYKKKDKKQNVILNIARLRKQKDHFTLLKAFNIFLKVNKNYKLIILGHGNLYQKLKLYTHKLGIQKKVIFKGWVSNTKTYLRKSKIFVLSSVYEGLGNVLIDAVNYNIPCVSTNCPSGPSEILLDGKGGYLVKPKSHIMLAKKLIFCNQNYEQSLEKNKLAKKKLYRFSVQSNTKNYFNYLNSFY